MEYKKRKEMIAMLLAGGQGSRLGVLTEVMAKPAVPYGGKYRIIDFPLSNCVNSGVDTIGVLTQYRPLELNAYIGSGQPWDLDRIYGGVYILPPYVKGKEGEWYKGTANAIYQNIQFIDLYDPEYVLILSGDHIYKMDYEKMLDFHTAKRADCTIAVLNVPLEEAHRFGVMNADSNLKIYEFEEKPAKPKSNLASMGVYIFKWNKLREYLVKDEAKGSSSNDFGKDVIPAMLEAGEKMYAYEFKGYWKDVGTIDSLWEANMDLLDPNVELELYDPLWRIYSRNYVQPAQVIGSHAKLENCDISEGCIIDGHVDGSIVFPGVSVGQGAFVRKSVIMPGAVIEKGAVVEYSIIAPDAVIGENAVVGAFADEGDEANEDACRRPITVVGQYARVEAGDVIAAGVMIEAVEKEVQA